MGGSAHSSGLANQPALQLAQSSSRSDSSRLCRGGGTSTPVAQKMALVLRCPALLLWRARAAVLKACHAVPAVPQVRPSGEGGTAQPGAQPGGGSKRHGSARQCADEVCAQKQGEQNDVLLVQAAAARPVGMRLSPLAGRPRHNAGDSSRGHSQRACNVPPSCLRPVTCSSGTFLPKALDSIVSRIEARVSAATHLPVSHAENLQILRWVGEGGWGPEGCCLLRWVGGRAREGCCLLRGRCTSAPLAAGCTAAMPPLVVWLGALQGLTHSPL